MAQPRLVHTKRISPKEIRELDVYYDKGGLNYFDYTTKPKGIFFSSTVYEQEEGSIWKTLKIGLGKSKPGVGYICVVPLDAYRAKALRQVRERVEAHAEAIHALCDIGDAQALEQLKAILSGEITLAQGEARA
ncbi:hypothetical protein LX81_03031 [Palleronia aestuarii]|uniref:Uncharacterized protein n=1 Tax=Palleronia aestuarii TaxID=568105 RepID=A0A2W7NSK1_9RHOB|nr:hypothetical protein [Palleronia aestuarii]PZX14232.1 hypothetical protein LX81_03031 [Palleronia aestuarii]